MVKLTFEDIGTWYQCPQCFSRRFLTSKGVFEEIAAYEEINSSRDRAAQRAAAFAKQRALEEDETRKANEQREKVREEERSREEVAAREWKTRKEKEEAAEDRIKIALFVASIAAPLLIWKFIGLFWAIVAAVVLFVIWDQ